jgi:hypothetical protein
VPACIHAEECIHADQGRPNPADGQWIRGLPDKLVIGSKTGDVPKYINIQSVNCDKALTKLACAVSSTLKPSAACRSKRRINTLSLRQQQHSTAAATQHGSSNTFRHTSSPRQHIRTVSNAAFARSIVTVSGAPTDRCGQPAEIRSPRYSLPLSLTP